MDRISDVVLVVPSVRDMREDIPWLWKRMYEKTKKDLEATDMPRSLGEEDHSRIVELLLAHQLPGNFRDLRRVAVHIIGKLNDPTPSEFKVEDVFEEALAWSPVSDLPSTVETSRRVAAAFGANSSLQNSGPWIYPLDFSKIVEDLTRDLKFWLGWQVRRIAVDRTNRRTDQCKAGQTRSSGFGERGLRTKRTVIRRNFVITSCAQVLCCRYLGRSPGLSERNHARETNDSFAVTLGARITAHLITTSNHL